MSQSPPPPPVIATIGLHGSASTWVFNVVRELMLAAVGEDRVRSLVADTVAELPPEPGRHERHLVIKSHHGSAELDRWLDTVQPRIILSIRDPRDASISMSQRFKAQLADSVRWLGTDCRRMLTLAAAGHPLLRYEDRFFDDPATVTRLAATLGLSLKPQVIDDIFSRYRTETVRTFARGLSELPPARVTQFGDSHLVDTLTQIHGVHIGDAQSDKWRHLPPAAQDALSQYFAVFLERFGYGLR